MGHKQIHLAKSDVGDGGITEEIKLIIGECWKNPRIEILLADGDAEVNFIDNPRITNRIIQKIIYGIRKARLTERKKAVKEARHAKN